MIIKKHELINNKKHHYYFDEETNMRAESKTQLRVDIKRRYYDIPANKFLSNNMIMNKIILLFLMIPFVSASNIEVSINTNFFIIIVLFVFFVISLLMALRSDGKIKSIISVSGIFLMCIGLEIFYLLKHMTDLYEPTIYILYAFSSLISLLSLVMIIIGIKNWWQTKEK